MKNAKALILLCLCSLGSTRMRSAGIAAAGAAEAAQARIQRVNIAALQSLQQGFVLIDVIKRIAKAPSKPTVRVPGEASEEFMAVLNEYLTLWEFNDLRAAKRNRDIAMKKVDESKAPKDSREALAIGKSAVEAINTFVAEINGIKAKIQAKDKELLEALKNELIAINKEKSSPDAIIASHIKNIKDIQEGTSFDDTQDIYKEMKAFQVKPQGAKTAVSLQVSLKDKFSDDDTIDTGILRDYRPYLTQGALEDKKTIADKTGYKPPT